jgi:hypothetical protein
MRWIAFVFLGATWLLPVVADAIEPTESEPESESKSEREPEPVPEFEPEPVPVMQTIPPKDESGCGVEPSGLLLVGFAVALLVLGRFARHRPQE